MKKVLGIPAVVTIATIAASGTLASCSAADQEASSGGDAVQSEPERSDVTGASQEDPPTTYRQYVALGDSYAAMGSRDTQHSGPEECFRSGDNYPTLLAEDEHIENFVDATCASAVTQDVTSVRTGDEGFIPAQIDSITEDIDLVTISIGGNDIGFPEIAGCFQEAAAAGTESDCASRFPDNNELFGAAPEMLFHTYSSIQNKAPGADVFVTGYLPLITENGDCPDAGFISDEDREWAVSLTNELNELISKIASELHFTFVLPEEAAEHTVCAEPSQRWTDVSGVETGAYPMHPTALGQEAMAQAISEAISAKL